MPPTLKEPRYPRILAQPQGRSLEGSTRSSEMISSSGLPSALPLHLISRCTTRRPSLNEYMYAAFALNI